MFPITFYASRFYFLRLDRFLPHERVRRMAEEHLSRFHHRFGECRMRMHNFGDVAGGGAHLDCQHALRNQLARVTTSDADARMRSVSGSIISFVMPSVRSKLSARPEAPHGNFTISTTCPFAFASASVKPHQATSGVRKDHGRNDDLVPLRAFAANRLDGNARLFVRLVGQHHAARDVADGADDRVGCLPSPLELTLMKPFSSRSTLVFSKPRSALFGTRPTETSTRAVSRFVCQHSARVDGHLDLLTSGGHLRHLGLQTNLFEILFRQLRHRANEVRIRAGENRVHRLDYHDVAAKPRVNGAKFHADVATANDEQALGNLFDVQRLRRRHDARIAQVLQRLRHRRLGADGDDGLVILDDLRFYLPSSRPSACSSPTCAGDDLNPAPLRETGDPPG